MNRQLLLARLPSGLVEPGDFQLRETDVPAPGDGEVLIRNRVISCDPTQRGWLNGFRTYIPPVAVGEVMPAWCAGEVVESRHPSYRKGDRVWGTLSWQDYAISKGDGVFPLSKIPEDVPLSYPLGVTGITGVTAYIGMLERAKPTAGETVVVSTAAGATGSVAAQLAKLQGARVIGIAGGPEKCAWLLDELKLDGAIDYKNEKLHKRLQELCPSGVNVYYDNVGGPILDALFMHMATHGRIVNCGSISQGYGTAPPLPLPNAYMMMLRSLTVMSILIFNHMDRFAVASEQLLGWVRSGKIKFREDVVEGLENAPLALRRVFEGKNFGKQLVKLD